MWVGNLYDRFQLLVEVIFAKDSGCFSWSIEDNEAEVAMTMFQSCLLFIRCDDTGVHELKVSLALSRNTVVIKAESAEYGLVVHERI